MHSECTCWFLYLRTCYQESEQTKANDMEGSGHWDCTVFSCILGSTFHLFFTSFWVGSAPVSTRCVRMAILSPSQGILGSRGCLSLSPQPLQSLVLCSLPWDALSPGRDWGLLEPQQGWESALYTRTVWGLPGIWALSGWVRAGRNSPQALAGHQFSFLLFLFPKWTNLCQRRRATFPSITCQWEKLYLTQSTEMLTSHLCYFGWRLQQVIFSESQT